MNEFQQYYGQQLAPQQMGQMGQIGQMGGMAPMGFLGGMFGAPLGGLIGRGIGGLLGNARLGNQIGQVAGGIGGSFLPLGADPVSAAYAQQAQQQQLQQLQLQQQIQQQMMQQPGMQQPGDLSAQGWFGNLVKQVARPLGGAIGGAFGNAGIGNAIGGIAGQLGGMLPFGADPVSMAYAQQAQQEALMQQQGLAPQGWFGNLVKHVARPLGGAIGGAFGNAGMGNTIGGIAGQLGGMLPFGADPVSQAYAQQAQQEAQMQLQSLVGPTPGVGSGWLGNLWRNRLSNHFNAPHPGYPRIGSQPIGQTPNLLPFGADPMAQAYALQEAQMQQMQDAQGLTPQGGWFGNLIKNVAQPLGGAIGGAFGNAGLGNTIGGIAGQLGGMLPFGADPVTAAYAQQAARQAQLAQLAQQQVGNGAMYGGQQTLH